MAAGDQNQDHPALRVRPEVARNRRQNRDFLPHIICLEIQTQNKELFHRLPVVLGNTKKTVSKKSVTVTVAKTGESLPSTKSVTVTVKTPGGYKIEGLTAEQLAVFFRKIGAG